MFPHQVTAQYHFEVGHVLGHAPRPLCLLVGHVGHAFIPIPGKYRINYYNKGVNNSIFRESREKDVTHLTQTAQMQWWCGVEGVMESVTQNVTQT